MKNLIESKWEEILSLLENQYDISNIMINTWISSLKIYEVKNKTVYFYVDEKLGENAIKFILKKEFDFFLLSSIRETLNDSDINIHIDEKKNYLKNDISNDASSNSSISDSMKKNSLNPKYTFETFIVGDGNRHAQATCLAVADMPGQDNLNPLFLYGKSGLGKTHLMQSIAHYIIQNNTDSNVLYVQAEEFTNEIIDAIRNHTTKEFREKYRKVDVLLIDDVQFLIGKESTQNEFFNTFNTLYNNNKQIILSSDKPPKEIKTLDIRIKSRFECGIPIDIHEPDYETRMAILKNKAEIDHLTEIPDDVFAYIAENVTTNVRELEGALNKIGALHNIMREDITLEKSKDILKDIINKDLDYVLTPEYIIKTVSEFTNVSVESICSSDRSQNISTARQIVMYLCKNYATFTLGEIGDSLGGKNHSTIISGIKKIEQKLKEDNSFKATVDAIIRNLGSKK